MCELEKLDSIVIDDGIEPQWVEKLKAADVQVHIAATNKKT
jgi:DeoR/GlpR family transcriptional regulator of sugar metabolism